jgi:RHS repeat-associated protein
MPFTWDRAPGYDDTWHLDIGLYHVGARAYDPRTARWLQRDPIDASSGDPNLYRYADIKVSPARRREPS